jgi:hypothetical protein
LCNEDFLKAHSLAHSDGLDRWQVRTHAGMVHVQRV